MKPLFQTHECLSEKDIQAYINGTLPDARRFYVENHLLDCPLCDEAVEGYEAMELANLELAATQGNGEAIRISLQRSRWMRLAAALLLLIVAVFALYQVGGSSDQRLFAQAFTPYESDLNVIVRRSEAPVQDPTSLQPALQAGAEDFDAGKFEESITHFNTYLQQKPDNQLVRFHLGVAQLESNRLEDAIKTLNVVLGQSRTYQREAIWYLSLALLKNRERAAAKQTLEKLIAQGPGRYYEEAKKLHSKL